MNFTPEQIQQNWEEFLNYIKKYISSPRKEKLLEFYNKYEERIAMMPASYKPQFHSCFPGGYVYHVLNVLRAALKIDKVWRDEGTFDTYTTEELIFSAINHDLGKMGNKEHACYIPNSDVWRKEKLGEVYMFNNQLPYMTVPDRSLYLLTEHGIEYSLNEYLAIKLHDGVYDDANKSYLMSFNPETKPRTSLIYILHQADLLASRIEYEKEWFPKIYGPKEEKKKKTFTKQDALNKNLKSIGNNEALNSVINSFFDKK